MPNFFHDLTPEKKFGIAGIAAGRKACLACTTLAGNFVWSSIASRVGGLVALAALFFAWSLRVFGTYRRRL